METEGSAVNEVTKEIAITRMDCPTCTATIEKSIMKVPGVKSVRANYLKKTVRVTYDDSTPISEIEKAIEDVGYQVAYKKYSSPLDKLRGIFGKGERASLTLLADADFEDKVLKASRPAAVLFSSATCPSCQVLKPKLSELAKAQSGRVDFYEMDVGETDVWKEYGVMGIPTVIVFRGGKPSERFGAMLSVGDLEKALKA
jgi:thioredoxin 1